MTTTKARALVITAYKPLAKIELNQSVCSTVSPGNDSQNPGSLRNERLTTTVDIH